LPYRKSGPALDAPFEVMLITSRGTGRWVIPKGNTSRNLSDHAAAEREATEEAGVVGAICPVPIGTYSYRKVLSSGASRLTQVAVFPLAVTSTLDDWKEAGQRTRQWFNLAQAAALVDEDELRDMLYAFGPISVTEPSYSAAKGGPKIVLKEGFKMFHWFQSLLPRQADFFEKFEAHAQLLTAGSDALARLLQGENMADHIREINEREDEADAITRDVLQTVRRTFLTPFDRGAITSLITSMDDAIDQMRKTGGAIDLYDVREFEPEMRDMAAIIVDASRLLAEALPLLRSINANATRLHELTERLVRMEDQADTIHDKGLKRLYQELGNTNPVLFLIRREIYSHLEKVVDRFEDVANEIDGLVIDHA
jgi:predicted phosphate transport protein (TIGR00153 family)